MRRLNGLQRDRSKLEGVNILKESSYKIMPDRIEAGTYA